MRSFSESTPNALLCICSLLFFCTLSSSHAADTITRARPLRDGETIVSAGGTYELGFFSPGSSKTRYLAIWFKNPYPFVVVWVANRGAPIFDSSGVLELNNQGDLILLNRTQSIVWSTNLTNSAENPVAQLLDSGDFVIREENEKNRETNSLWHSFEHPSDTFLPGMKLGFDRVSGREQFITSWRSSDDPSPGNITFGLHPKRLSELVLSKNSVVLYRTGPWNGMGFSGTSGMKLNHIFEFDLVFNDKEVFYSYKILNSSVFSMLVLNPNGTMQRYIMDDSSREWETYLFVNIQDCMRYAVCGPYGRCNVNDYQTCSCLEGFQPKSQDWYSGNWSSGCVRKKPLKCGDRVGFLKVSGVKLPDAIDYWYNGSMKVEQCRSKCAMDCSCTAHASINVKGGPEGCLLWFNELLDIGDSSANTQDFYVKRAASELGDGDMMKPHGKSTTSTRMKLIVSAAVVMGVLLLGLSLVLLHGCKRREQQPGHANSKGNLESHHSNQKEDLNLPIYDFGIIIKATSSFSSHNILGEGGFGRVYKGMLSDGQEIAVKRLSKGSSQGLEEFKNEVSHIAKLQHRNLVKLLGFCVDGDEKMLIYEYMPNRSLDSYIFDQTKSKELDWPKRFHIIDGIARGLLYLHQDSRLRIIHRDLKASNILLDSEMNPKISDFGMARSFAGNENEANTKRVVGTYGYMSPEYAVDGHYSTKSDIFSFGVLVLEIVSGKKNRGFRHPEHHLNLLGHAWKLCTENRPVELIDDSLPPSSINLSEALRLIHLGLLCVQRHAEDRPSISYVLQMLDGESSLQPPKQPGFFNERDPFEVYYSQVSDHPSPTCNVTITTLEPR